MGCDAVIVASGSSRRMGFDKLAAPIAGLPVLRRTVEAFAASAEIGRIIVVCPTDRFETLLAGCPAPLVRVDGGKERHDSVAAGLAEVTADMVAIHDGARPLVTPEAIAACLDAAREHHAAALARPVTDTLKHATPDGLTDAAVSREGLWHMETPQVFETALIRRAYAEVAAKGLVVTDEVSALETLGIPTRLVAHGSPNLKITHPADLKVAEALLRLDASDLP